MLGVNRPYSDLVTVRVSDRRTEIHSSLEVRFQNRTLDTKRDAENGLFTKLDTRKSKKKPKGTKAIDQDEKEDFLIERNKMLPFQFILNMYNIYFEENFFISHAEGGRAIYKHEEFSFSVQKIIILSERDKDRFLILWIRIE